MRSTLGKFHDNSELFPYEVIFPLCHTQNKLDKVQYPLVLIVPLFSIMNIVHVFFFLNINLRTALSFSEHAVPFSIIFSVTCRKKILL